MSALFYFRVFLLFGYNLYNRLKRKVIYIKTIKIDLPSELTKIELHTFADLHIGDRACDLELVQKRICEVQNNPNAFCILNGDIMNNATKTSVSDCYAEELSPMEQLERFTSLFEPIKDKILAITQGNHENRTYIKEGIDLTHVAAKQLGVEDKYSKTGAVLFIRFGEENKSGHHRKMCYTLYCNHGSGGGRKEGAKAIRLADMASIIDVDIYIHSHTHLPMIMKQGFYRIDTSNSYVAHTTKLFVNTAASLNYGGYGETFEFKPSSKDTPVIFLNGRAKEMNARL